MWTEAVVGCFKGLFPASLGETEEDDYKSLSVESVTWTKFELDTL
jgi:hypothetical protein